MKHHHYLSIPAIFAIALFIFVACQETPELSTTTDSQDQVYLEKAMQDGRNYINELEENVPEASRTKWEKPNLVGLLYKIGSGGKLLYYNWHEHERGYVEVTEEEVTAIVQPNTIICHFRGGGLSALNAIEFDEASRSMIGVDNNFEYWKDYCWITFIPPSVPENSALKYDIVYDVRNDGEEPIRLDPKIEIKGQGE